MYKSLKYVLLSLVSCYPVINVHAEQVSFEISATVYNVDDIGNSLDGSVTPGDIITGTYTLDLATPDSDPSPEYGHYPHNTAQSNPISVGFDLILNNHSLKSDQTIPGHMVEAHVMNSYSDHFSMGSWGNQPLANGTNVDDIMLDLYDSTGQAQVSDALTSQAPNLNAFEIHDIHVFGSSVNYDTYYIDAKIDSISVIGSGNQTQCSLNTSPNEKFLLNATVREIWDDGNVITNNINIGDTISGSYTFNTSTPDIDSSPNIGFFEHQPGSGDYGFDLSINSLNIKTDPNSNQFNIFMFDGVTDADIYSADTYGAQIPFINGSLIDSISVHINDPSRNTITSATLTNTPPILSGSEQIREVYISGMGNTAMGSSYFSIIATLNTIENDCSEPQSQVIISPAEGTFTPAQRFDAAIILEPGLANLIAMQGTLNGMDISPVLSSCYPGAPNIQNRQTFVCPDFSNMLMPGTNNLDINFNLSDGSLLHQSISWQLIGL